MEYWEFLLQKEGDRTWVPIKSKTQIVAGRYRVVAHSSRTNTDVEICITHESTEEVPPKRRSQKRSRRTNPEGLMVVIPFTYLRSGQWELRCCGDIMSDFLGLSWQQSVQLVVLPQITEVALSELPSPLLASATTEMQSDLSENAPLSCESVTSATVTSDQVVNEDLLPKENLVPVEANNSDSHTNSPKPLVTEQWSLKKLEPTQIETPSEVYSSPQSSAPQLTPLVDQEEVESEQELSVEIKEVTLPNSKKLPDRDEEYAALLENPDTSRDATPLTQQDAVEPNVLASNGQTPKPESEIVEESNSIESNPETTSSPQDLLSEEPTIDIDQTQTYPAFLADPLVAQALAEFDQDQNTVPAPQSALVKPTNPILDQSLQMIEEILQQVLDPVMQEFEGSESSTPEVISNSELSLESATDQQGLILTLDEESLVARRGHSLTISGQVDILDIDQLNGVAKSREWKTAFLGTLRYELRDPQNSRILLEVEQSLPEQPLPITFSHTLEIPPDCKTRLILGKVTLCDQRGRRSAESTPVALASQPFTVTADLDELLGAIIPETQVMPVAKIIVKASNPAPLPDYENDSPEVPGSRIEQPVLDLVDVTRSRPPLSLKPSSASPLPPQIYQPTAKARTSKSLQLPNLPKLRPITESVESAAVPMSSLSVETSVGHASSPILTLSEQELVETKQDNSRAQVQLLAPATSEVVTNLESSNAVVATFIDSELPAETTLDSSSAVVATFINSELPAETTKSLAVDATDEDACPTLEDTEPESQLNEAMQELEEAMSQIQGAVSLSSAAIASEVSDSTVLSPESPNGTIPLGDDSAGESVTLLQAADPELVKADSLFDTQDTPDSIEATIEQSEATDAWESATTSADASLNQQGTLYREQETIFNPKSPEVTHASDTLSEAGLDSTLEQKDSPEPELVAVDNAFQSLNVQDRFWLRLNSLATDTELSQSLRSNSARPSNLGLDEEDHSVTNPPQTEPVGVNVEEVTQPLTSNTLLNDFDESMWEEESEDFDDEIAFSARSFPGERFGNRNGTDQAKMAHPIVPEEIADTDIETIQPLALEDSTSSEAEILNESSLVDMGEIDWAAREFVVDEEDENAPAQETPQPQPESAQQLAPEEQPTPDSQPQSQSRPQREIISPRRLELPIPAPELSIPMNELAAGEPVTVRVTLPPHPARLCVKLWVQDRQSRSLLDGPRWLMDLIPDRTGEQEALTQLTVPFGSVEIRFEAISVDIDSQRESHKVSIDCVVIPPDLPNFSFDDFEG